MLPLLAAVSVRTYELAVEAAEIVAATASDKTTPPPPALATTFGALMSIAPPPCCAMPPPLSAVIVRVPLVVRTFPDTVSMLPVPFACKVIPLAPVIFCPRVMLPFDVVLKLNEVPLKAAIVVTLCESVANTLPEVVAARFGALTKTFAPDVPMSPLDDESVTVPVEPLVTAKALGSVIVPAPLAVSVTEPGALLLTLRAPPTTILPVVPDIARVKFVAVEAPTVTLLALSLIDTVPPLVVLSLAALVAIAVPLPIEPVPALSDSVPLVPMVFEPDWAILPAPAALTLTVVPFKLSVDAEVEESWKVMF